MAISQSKFYGRKIKKFCKHETPHGYETLQINSDDFLLVNGQVQISTLF